MNPNIFTKKTFRGTRFASQSNLDSIKNMSSKSCQGRNLQDGSYRGMSLNFGDFSYAVQKDPIFQKAWQIAKPYTVVGLNSIMNLYQILTKFLPENPKGHIAEFGVYRGGTLLFMATVAKEMGLDIKVIGFDTFEGMPDITHESDTHQKGDFSKTSMEKIAEVARQHNLNNIVLSKGLFSDTITSTLDRFNPIALAHIDCDLYQSLIDSYDGVKPYMAPQGYIVFDDPLASKCLGAFQAVEEVVIRRDGLSAEQTYPHLVYRYPPLKDEVSD